MGYGARADVILAAYPHATAAEATRAAANLARDSTFAWHTWAWALLQSEKGKGRAYLYYFDYHQPDELEGASHGTEMGYVFGNLQGPGAMLSHLKGPAKPDDLAMSNLLSSYWVNFAKTGDPNAPGFANLAGLHNFGPASHVSRFAIQPPPGPKHERADGVR